MGDAVSTCRWRACARCYSRSVSDDGSCTSDVASGRDAVFRGFNGRGDMLR
jgi:hypothetical protein